MAHILQHGLYPHSHPAADPKYVNIGDNDLIVKRDNYQVRIIPPGGALGDYIPFYFGPLSPMLYNIKTGYRGISQRPQNEIVYILCKLSDVCNCCKEWCFTDGHAKKAITEFYNDPKDIDKIDWDIVKERFWNNTDEDFDRMRRKQAEFLVKEHIPAKCISGIAVYDERTKSMMDNLVERLALKMPVKAVDKFYY